jgi:hypothetical protein
MRIAIKFGLLLLLSAAPCTAQDQKVSGLSDAERAKIKAQVEGLKQTKIKQSDDATNALRNKALKEGQEIDKTLNQHQQRIDKTVEHLPWLVGEGQDRKNAYKNEADRLKQKTAADAKKRAAAHAAAASKSAQNVQDSIEGLKSQVGADGKYGLKPKGSNLYVRQYGDKK